MSGRLDRRRKVRTSILPLDKYILKFRQIWFAIQTNTINNSNYIGAHIHSAWDDNYRCYWVHFHLIEIFLNIHRLFALLPDHNRQAIVSKQWPSRSQVDLPKEKKIWKKELKQVKHSCLKVEWKLWNENNFRRSGLSEISLVNLRLGETLKLKTSGGCSNHPRYFSINVSKLKKSPQVVRRWQEGALMGNLIGTSELK